jgi:hypothetical protein
MLTSGGAARWHHGLESGLIDNRAGRVAYVPKNFEARSELPWHSQLWTVLPRSTRPPKRTGATLDLDFDTPRRNVDLPMSDRSQR